MFLGPKSAGVEASMRVILQQASLGLPYLLPLLPVLCGHNTEGTANPAKGYPAVGFGYGTTHDGLHWTLHPAASIILPAGMPGSVEVEVGGVWCSVWNRILHSRMRVGSHDCWA
jgi:hypothetical protein